MHCRSCVRRAPAFVMLLAVVVSGCGSTAVTELTSPSNVACAVTIAAPQQILAPHGDQLNVSIAAARDCLWSANSQASWLQVSPSSGQGDAELRLIAAINANADTRVSTVVVNDARITVVQAGTPLPEPDPMPDVVPSPESTPPPQPPSTTPPGPLCALSISPREATVDHEEQSGQIAVSVAVGCPWSATSTVGWIAITAGSAGLGPGTVRYSIERYSGNGTRNGRILIGGQTFTITQRRDKDD
jgi:hypothetical protein